MINLKKGLNLKAVLAFTVLAFFLNSAMAYGINLPRKAFLRVYFLTKQDKGSNRLDSGLIAILKHRELISAWKNTYYKITHQTAFKTLTGVTGGIGNSIIADVLTMADVKFQNFLKQHGFTDKPDSDAVMEYLSQRFIETAEHIKSRTFMRDIDLRKTEGVEKLLNGAFDIILNHAEKFTDAYLSAQKYIVDRAEYDFDAKGFRIAASPNNPNHGIYLKTGVAEKIVRRHLPVHMMQKLGYANIDDLLADFGVIKVFSLMRYSEPISWTYAEILPEYQKLTAGDFETRPLQLFVLDIARWKDIFHPEGFKIIDFGNDKVVGTVFAVNIDQDNVSPERIFNYFMKTFHYILEVDFYCKYYEMYLESNDFNKRFYKVLAGHWPNHYKYPFETHSTQEWFDWLNTFAIVSKISGIETDMDFWIEHLMTAKQVEGSADSMRFLSLNIFDVWKYVKHREKGAVSGYFNTRVWVELAARFVGGINNLEYYVIKNMENNRLKPFVYKNDRIKSAVPWLSKDHLLVTEKPFTVFYSAFHRNTLHEDMQYQSAIFGITTQRGCL